MHADVLPLAFVLLCAFASICLLWASIMTLDHRQLAKENASLNHQLDYWKRLALNLPDEVCANAIDRPNYEWPPRRWK